MQAAEGSLASSSGVLSRKRRWIRARRYATPLILAAIFCSVLYAATHLTEAQPDDGKVYSQIARNLVEQGVYSTEKTAPFSPTLIRVPGYPIFLAAVYAIAGVEDVPAVRAAQGALHFATAVLAGLLAYLWCAGKKRRRRKAAVAAFVSAPSKSARLRLNSLAARLRSSLVRGLLAMSSKDCSRRPSSSACCSAGKAS